MADTKKTTKKKSEPVETVPVEVEAKQTKTEVALEEKMVEVFMKQNVFLPKFKPLYLHQRYKVPASKLKDLPEDSYVKI